MLDETLIFQLVKKVNPGLATWYPGWPERFEEITDKKAIACWKIDQNSVAISTSSNPEFSTRLRVQLNTWSKTPEQRMKLNAAIDDVFIKAFKRVSVSPVEETLPGNVRAFRSIMIYEGTYQKNMGVFR